MNIPHDTRIALPWGVQHDTLCLYLHTVDGTVIFVGCCPLIDVFKAPDARDNTAWIDLVTPETVLTTYIVQTGATYADLYPERQRLQRHYKPFCNYNGHSTRNKRCAIICDQDSKSYPSQTAAARFYGLSLSALSNHLKKRPGHKSVKGRTFHYDE